MSTIPLTNMPFEDIGYFAIFLLMAIDGANIPFTPSELFLGFTGFLARTGEIQTVMAYAVGFLGSLTGNICSFYIGRKAGRPIFERYGKYILLTPERLDQAQERVKKLGAAAPLVARFIPGLRNVSSFILGALHVSPGSFILLTATGLAIYNALFFLLGFILAEEAASLKEIVFYGGITIMIVGLCLVGVTWHRLRKQNQ